MAAKFKYEVLIGTHEHTTVSMVKVKGADGKEVEREHRTVVTCKKGDTFESDHELVGVDAPGCPPKLKLVSAPEPAKTK